MPPPPATWKLALGALGYGVLWVCAFEIDDDAVKIGTSLCVLLAACFYLVTVVRRERRRGPRRPRSGGVPPELRRPLVLRQFVTIRMLHHLANLSSRRWLDAQ